jgi:hypothetical protein
MEIFDLGALNDLEPISLNFDDISSSSSSSSSKPSSSFGSGIELLMNDKKKSSNNINIDLGELDNLEKEINQGINGAKSTNPSGETKTLSGFASNLFNLGGFTSAEKPAATTTTSDSNLGNATRESAGNTKTWDGFSKMSGEIPLNGSGSSAKMSDRERRVKKRMMIKKLEEWYEKKLIKHSSHYTMESPFEDIEDDYETALEDKRKKDSIKLQGWWFMTFINSMEYANAAFNPFDLNLDGWGEQVNEDIDSYEEIFGELHDKYKGGKLAPEISLLLRIGFSAAVLNFSNKALSSATPAFNDVIKQSPELMRMFTNATVSSMSQQSPGFAMANNLMQDTMNRPQGGPPPAAVETKNMPAMQHRPGMTFTGDTQNRPDINAGRGAMFRESGVDIGGGFDVNGYNSAPQMQQQQSMRPVTQQQQQRPEMRGPQSSDIDNILAGLKTRNVNIQETNRTDDDSMISIGSLKDMQNGTAPRSSRRKNGSNKNTISLDI